MNTRTVWGFSPENREFTYEVVCYPCPLNKGEYTLPVHYVPVKPVVGENEAAVANADASDWLIVADYRGKVFYDREGTQHEITERGQTPDSTWALERPLTPEQLILKSIFDLEIQVTQRRLRDAVLTEDGRAWLDDIESQIDQLRQQLPAV